MKRPIGGVTMNQFMQEKVLEYQEKLRQDELIMAEKQRKIDEVKKELKDFEN